MNLVWRKKEVFKSSCELWLPKLDHSGLSMTIIEAWKGPETLFCCFGSTKKNRTNIEVLTHHYLKISKTILVYGPNISKLATHFQEK